MKGMPTLAELHDLTDRVAIVTGGSRGIGRCIVQTLAEAGATVVVASRKLDNCEAVADEVRRTTGRPAVAMAFHAGRWDDCDRLVVDVVERFGRLDVLVNNAGMSPTYPSLDAVTEDLYDKTLAVNLKGPFRLTALIGTHMAAHDGGSIINISSVEAERPEPHALPYAAAKAGLEALTGGFAHAFGPTVRVNTIRCGMFRTDIAKAWGDPAAIDELARRRMDLQRIGEPEDIVGAALYLASDASAYCTGATLRLDGGIR